MYNINIIHFNDLPSTTKRICVVSTPRSGTTVLSRALAYMFEAEWQAFHLPRELAAQELPDRLVCSVHWYPVDARWSRPEERNFKTFLRDQGFACVTIQRPAEDLLASIREYSSKNTSANMWLGGQNGNEKLLEEGSDTSTFRLVRYALSRRFRALLRVSKSWEREPGTICIDYRDIANDLGSVLTAIRDATFVSTISPHDAAASIDFNADRAQNQHYHYWRGVPRSGRELPFLARLAAAWTERTTG